MKLQSAGRFFFWVVVAWFVLSQNGTCQSATYLGVYASDGKYETPSKHARWENQQKLQDESDQPGTRPAEVPGWVNLHPIEDTIPNYVPPKRAVSSKASSGWAHFRDNLVTFAYGHERVIAAPQRVTTDSQDRLIAVDPAGFAVHVLAGEKSFRILTGPGRRIQHPTGVATDAKDNIYIADSEQGLIAVYDPNGRFLQYIGNLGHDETLFHVPTGIAIDRRSGILYVLDTERHLLLLLDLQGHVIRRVGRFDGNDTVVDFEYPTEIAVGAHELAIMDAAGSRIWITDLRGVPLHSFPIAVHVQPDASDRVGLAVDRNGDVYVSHTADSSVRIYNRGGLLLGSLGRLGQGAGEFRIPSGLWIDGQSRIYVADQSLRRVQVFQVRLPPPLLLAGGE